MKIYCFAMFCPSFAVWKWSCPWISPDEITTGLLKALARITWTGNRCVSCRCMRVHTNTIFILIHVYSYLRLYVYLYLYIYIYRLIYLSIYLTHLSIYPSIYLSNLIYKYSCVNTIANVQFKFFSHMHISLYIRPSIPPASHPATRLSTHLPTHEFEYPTHV